MASGCCGMRWKTVLLTLLVVGMVVLHQDFWNWTTAKPLVFGFLPIGLAYHAGYSVGCAVLMWVLVRTAWPKHLETLEGQGVRRDGEGH